MSIVLYNRLPMAIGAIIVAVYQQKLCSTHVRLCMCVNVSFKYLRLTSTGIHVLVWGVEILYSMVIGHG